MNVDRVQCAFDVGKRLPGWNERRMHAEVECSVFEALGNSQRPNGVAKLLRVSNIPRVDLLDALRRDFFRRHARTKREPREEGKLVASVTSGETFYQLRGLGAEVQGL